MEELPGASPEDPVTLNFVKRVGKSSRMTVVDGELVSESLWKFRKWLSQIADIHLLNPEKEEHKSVLDEVSSPVTIHLESRFQYPWSFEFGRVMMEPGMQIVPGVVYDAKVKK